MTKNYLLIVEGKVTEKDILSSVFERYGFKTYDCGQIDFSEELKEFVLTKLNTPNEDNIFIVQGPRNRIHDWLRLIDTKQDDFERYFRDLDGLFAGTFIIYDVDHTLKETLSNMFERYADETSSGLLLLSSPCIEVLSDEGRTEILEVDHLEEYKKELNKKFNQLYHCSAKQYIIDHFEESVLYYLEKNTLESNSKNVMDHPSFVLEKINELNDREFYSLDNQPVRYRYFTTVLYVCIAYINGLTKQIENADEVKNFFEKKLALRNN